MSDSLQKRLAGDVTEASRKAAQDVRARAHASVAKELLEEMGSAYARAHEKVDLAMAKLDTLARALAHHRAAPRSPRWGDDHQRTVQDFNAHREKAKTAIWELHVHREALGIRNHKAIDETWTLPHKESADE